MGYKLLAVSGQRSVRVAPIGRLEGWKDGRLEGLVREEWCVANFTVFIGKSLWVVGYGKMAVSSQLSAVSDQQRTN